MIIVFLFFSIPTITYAQESKTYYWAGYVKAVIEREFNLPSSRIETNNDTIRVHLTKKQAHLKDSIRSSLETLPSDKHLQFVIKEDQSSPKSAASTPSLEKTVFLPDRPLFDALMADPRWPHFSMSYQHYTDGEGFENVGHVTFGESFVFYRRNSLIRWELGLQAGVFSLFDLDAPSYDLINADYRVALPFSWRWKPLSGTFRVLHHSSHLGDEYILRGRAEERENLSYEQLDGLLSIDLPLGTRLYGGGSYIFHKDPSDLEPWSVQGGFEWVSPTGFWDGLLYPLAAVDVQSEEENDWAADVSAKAGVQLGGRDKASNNRLQLTLEYYQGHSPNGQFYDKSIEYIGIGLHYYRGTNY
jgi:hypothetical protein